MAGNATRSERRAGSQRALPQSRKQGKFEDVAAKAGVDRIAAYGMGVAVADFDNDGFPDIRNRLSFELFVS